MSSHSVDFRAVLFDYLYDFILSGKVGPSDMVAVLRFVKFANFESFFDDLDERTGVVNETDNETE